MICCSLPPPKPLIISPLPSNHPPPSQHLVHVTIKPTIISAFLSLNKINPLILSMAIQQTSSNSNFILTSGASGRINALFSARVLKSFLAFIYAFILFFLVPFRGRRRASVIGSSSEKLNKDEKHLESGAHRKGTAMVRVPAKIVPWKSSASTSTSSTSSSLSIGGGGGGVGDQEVASRRALAIRTVLEDNDPNCVREFSLFVSARGDTIFTQSWTPVSVKIRGIVVIMHGLNEHSGRYSDFAKQLNAHSFKVFGMDWIGHGGTDGLHAYVQSLDYAVADLKSFLGKILGEEPALPCFCFGHSTGAAIVLKAVLDPKIEAHVNGVVLTSPAVGVQPSHPIFLILAPIFSLLLPRFQISAANKKGMPVSRDPKALVAKYSDPLVYTGAIRVRTGYEILQITTYLQQNLNRLKVPFLVLHGTADTVTDPEASQKLYEEASSTDKTIKLFEGFLHDLLFELDREEVVKDIIDWLNCRVQG